MLKKIRPVILCGGSGTRLWPLSRKALPKQFVPIFNGKSLFQVTLDRFFSEKSSKKINSNSVELVNEAICVGSSQHQFLMQDIVSDSSASSFFILEPFARNTSAAMAAAALVAERDEILVFCPSDHFITDEASYLNTILNAVGSVDRNSIVALGAKPTFPSTAYGYMKVRSKLQQDNYFLVNKFIEKPNLAKATELISNENVFWNAGSFMAYSETVLSALERFAPDIIKHVKIAVENGVSLEKLLLLDKESMRNCRSESIDYAVMEKYDDVRMVSLESGWSDIGSWNALADLFEPDSHGNKSNGKAHFIDTKNTFIYSMGREVAAVGTKDLVVVETPDAILVSDINSAEKIRDVVNLLEEAHIAQAHSHRKVTRPWGFFDSIDQGDRFQVKRIVVKQGGRLSLQRHLKRAEHWVVVRGKARVTRGDDVFILEANQSTYIPLGIKHRLENPFDEPLEIIEVQSGYYFGEDDIERFDDIYGRE
ncbi:MAG: mannose-1-phosphate guanylyltransferase/mannose-6-phosphate isomerase [Betaproteobacteria bacterium TMED156]|nr:MAG: mannose-1-phosphate guanylyltransferase/mannose-6-phosphate isomerase [Betaproteobacteria bacterium TMED156]|tara:strand:- start:339 stop:1781 length:1443 start_codon:yes stop_codon:yes gene_type:complete